MGKKQFLMLALAILIAGPAIAQTSSAAQTGQATRSQRAKWAGEWKVGITAGGGTFYITLSLDGTATKSMGALHGTWEVVGSEARISWNDGWHDVIRRAGNHFEKAAYAPGQNFSDAPNNITSATRTEPM